MTKKMNLIIDYFLFLVSWLLIIYGVDVFLYLRGRRHNIIGINARRQGPVPAAAGNINSGGLVFRIISLLTSSRVGQ